MKKAINEVKNGPAASAQYSLAILAEGRFLFVTGQGPYNPATGKKDRGTIQRQTELTLNNLKAVIEAAGGRMEDVVSCRMYLQPLTHETFAAMNEVYGKFWGPVPPTRTTIGCSLLDMDVEADCVVKMNA
ncbi:MAG: RidA family protein [Elusimicrobiota bacterium]|nr:RidA family protein [Elusimicrobiota bacterium]